MNLLLSDPAFLSVAATVSGGGGDTDPYFSNVSLLLHGDGANGSTTIVDSSPAPKTVTAFGNAQISTAIADPFGRATAGVLAFDGSGDRLDITSSTDFSFGTGDFTVEAWIFQDVFNVDTLIDFRVASTQGFAIYTSVVNDGKPRVYSQGNTFLAGSSIALSSGAWNHFALVRASGTTKGYVNGVSGMSYADGANYQIGSARVAESNTLTQGLSGYIDDLRITKGVARYTANFTPPTAPFPDA